MNAAEHLSQMIYRKMYPCISHTSGPGRVKVNFGKTEFEWSDAKCLTPCKDDVIRTRRHGLILIGETRPFKLKS